MIDADAHRDLLVQQDGVLSRRQLLELGAHDLDIARLRRRRELTQVHPGVYVDHTGPLTTRQRECAAVLACWPAALSHESALPTGTGAVVHVAIDVRRTLRAPLGTRVHRLSHLQDRVDWQRSPPRVRLPEAVIDVWATRTDVWPCYRLLADAYQTRLTTPAHIAAALTRRPRVSGRTLLVAMLEDLATGAASVLEREYLVLERRHGLPAARRQQADRITTGRIYRDVPYPAYGVVVELDGRAFHEGAVARDHDLDRDLDTLVCDAGLTVRLGYGQVFGRGCATVAKVAALLRRGGWTGPFLRCADCP